MTEAAETDIAQQYDQVMSLAAEQGFTPDAANHFVASESQPQPQSDTVPAAADDSTPQQQVGNVSEQHSQAQSAIARILKNRNISGAGKLVGANGEVKSLRRLRRQPKRLAPLRLSSPTSNLP